MMTGSGRRSVAAILAGTAMIAGCSSAPTTVTVDKAWVRLGATPRIPAAAYFTLHGGPTAKTLINVTTDVAVKAEMHQSMQRGGMASMQPLGDLPIPAGAVVPFAPGGRHVMLFFMNPGIKPGRPITLTLSFGDGSRIKTSARTIGPGDAPPTFDD
jgi:copper(I)-binding protein